MSQKIMESTNGQICVNGHVQGQFVGANVVAGYTAVPRSSLEASSTKKKQMPSWNIGEGVNSGPATVRQPEKIGQSACHTDISHAANTEGERPQITMLEVTAAISGNTATALAQLSRARNQRSVARATRSTDPRRHTPQFQAYQEYCAIRSLDDMRLQSKMKPIPRPMTICNDYLNEISSERLRQTHLRPPTPPRPSPKRLGEEEREAYWEDDWPSVQIPPTTVNDAGWDKYGANEGTGDQHSQLQRPNRKVTARQGSQVDDGELEEGTADDWTKEEDSSQSNRLYMQEELGTLTRKIFGDEDEEDDGEFWDADGARPWVAIDHPAKDEGASMDHQDQESDTGGQSGENKGEANKESRLDGLFGSTSNVCLSTPFKDGLPPSHHDEDDDQDVEVVQEVLEAATNSATVDSSDAVNSSTDNTPPTTTKSTPLTSPEYPLAALHPSPPTQHPPLLDNGFGTLSTINNAWIGKLQPGESPEGHAGANDDLSDTVPVPTTQVDPPELEPCKPAVVMPSDEEPHCNTIHRIIQKRGLPEFSLTRLGMFSAVITSSSDNAPLGKRKRSREDDSDEGERAFSPASVSQRDHQVPRPRPLKKPKLEKNSSERALAILALSRPPEPEPVKRRTSTLSPPPPQFQYHKSSSSSEISTPPRTPPVISSLKRTKAKDNEVPSNRDSAHQVTTVPSPPAIATATANTTTTTSPKPAPKNYLPKAGTIESPSSSQPNNRKRKNREDDEDTASATEASFRLIKKPRRLAHIPIPTAEQSPVPKFEAYFLLASLRRADRVSYPLASETVAEVAQMIKGLDVKDPFKANRETSFPREDYTPYVTYVDCREKVVLRAVQVRHWDDE